MLPPINDGPWTIFEYDLDEYPWPRWVESMLDVVDLTGLIEDLPLRTWRTDQQSPWHDRFYAEFERAPMVAATYQRFVHEVIAPRMTEPFCYQRVPTFRVQLPGNFAVGEFHRDAQYGHPPGELSHWLPLTHAVETSSVWIEDDDGAVHAPEVWPGDVVVFDAVSRKHGNYVNRTGRSRVSFDFRTLPVRLLPEHPNVTEHTKMPFALGGYYAAEIVSAP
jgi:hypothetical protein